MAIPVLRPLSANIGYNTNSASQYPFCPSIHKTYHKLVSCAVPPSVSNNLVGSGSGVCLSVAAYLISHPDKVGKGGEDAFLVSRQGGGGVIAVADGVSGWAERDVDPALFSRELIANASRLLEEDEEVNKDPRSLIRKAHAATSSTGSATVVVAMLETNGIMKIASVGDCGVRVLRRGQVIYSTSPQQHYFDCPYQLSSEAIGQTFLDATMTTVELMEEDTVVMGSDGLFDNVFDREIISAVSSCVDDVSAAGMLFYVKLSQIHKSCIYICIHSLTNVSTIEILAKAIANLAHNHSMDSNYDSPYSQEARAQGFDVPWWKKVMGMKLTGGKLDDITVIVGKVISSQML